MKKVKKILFLSRDPGGTNPLVALHDILSGKEGVLFEKLCNDKKLEDNLELVILAKDYAITSWQDFGIQPLKWQDKILDNDVRAYLETLKPDWIITSTSHVDDSTEQDLWRLVEDLHIPTTAVLDSSHNVAMRFQDRDGQPVRPGDVFIPDEAARDILIAAGFSSDDLLIIGDVYGDFIKNTKSHKNVEMLRRQWGADKGDCLILFASDYISEAIKAGYSYDVTEFQYLDCFIEMLENGAIGKYHKALKPPYRLMIRPHPKDTPGKYDHYMAYQSDKISILQNSQGSSIEAVQAADVVVGMSSSLLHEAEVLGRECVRLMTIYPHYKGLQKKP